MMCPVCPAGFFARTGLKVTGMEMITFFAPEKSLKKRITALFGLQPLVPPPPPGPPPIMISS
jgi:hypothetical protein